MALHRFYNLEHSLKKAPKAAERNTDFMEGLIRAGHAVEVKPTNTVITNRNWYLPQNNVINPNKQDKTRVVFDASAKHLGVSLNSTLLRGPDFLSSLPGLIMRFRKYCITAQGANLRCCLFFKCMYVRTQSYRRGPQRKVARSC